LKAAIALRVVDVELTLEGKFTAVVAANGNYNFGNLI
jgi:hypothetical protein